LNVFVLDEDPERAARAQCDRHVVKMTLETAQLLCTVARLTGLDAPYRVTHASHPCVAWARASADNYAWLAMHGLALADEYERRYRRVHASLAVLCCDAVRETLRALPSIGSTPFVQCMPEELRGPDPVEAYRGYYRRDKARFARWNRGTSAPIWWRNDGTTL
jgi:hypothetical protein